MVHRLFIWNLNYPDLLETNIISKCSWKAWLNGVWCRLSNEHEVVQAYLGQLELAKQCAYMLTHDTHAIVGIINQVKNACA